MIQNELLRDIARKGIGITKYLSKCLPLKTIGQMYKVRVRSHLDCDIIFHTTALNTIIT